MIESPTFVVFLKTPVIHPPEFVGWEKKITTENRVSQLFGTKPWILLTGCFDGKRITDGHTSLIQALSNIAPVVIGIESDETLFWNKGMFRPFLHQVDRVERIAKLPEVSAVIPFITTVIYNTNIGRRTNLEFFERFLRMRPPIVPIYAFDPSNPYRDSMNGDAKSIGAERLVYELYPAKSTSQTLGY